MLLIFTLLAQLPEMRRGEATKQVPRDQLATLLTLPDHYDYKTNYLLNGRLNNRNL
jgi:hypothetical protein